MRRFHFFTCLLIATGASSGFAQEVVGPLYRNSALQPIEDYSDSLAIPLSKKATSLELPFFDDFSYSGVYPDKTLWQDRDVYVNSNFSIYPPSHGVATFDALDERGIPYNISGSKTSKPCDTLTSNPINLGDLKGSDSVYLSFFLQEKGLGENPDPEDYFILEFKNDSGKWHAVWRQKAIGKIIGDHPFKRHSINLAHPKHNFFSKDFQFRFRVQGNKTGALDHWHIDYVYLNKDRRYKDKLVSDVSLYRKPKGIFKTYFSLPYRHFVKNSKAYLNGKVEFHARNNDSVVHNPNINYRITDVASNKTIDSSKKNNQIAGLSPLSNKSGVQPSQFPAFHYQGASDHKIKLELALNIEATKIKADLPLTKSNDDFVMYQAFDDYFAYDDGSAEAAYALQVLIEGAVALEFRLEIPDTLRYIAFHFTGARDPLPQDKKFDIVVWEKLGTPGNEVVLATIKGAKPIYTGLLNGFALYELEKPLLLTGNFFVGWHQYRKFRLNVGLDMNYRFFNDSMPNPNLWYNTKGEWLNSTVVGTPLIRPVFGQNPSLSSQKVQKPQLTVYPNPISDFVTVQLDADGFTAELFNLQGQLITSNETASNELVLSTAQLEQGIYLIRVRDKNGLSFSQKLVKH